MKNTTPLFPGFHLLTLRRTPRSEQQKLADKLSKIKHKSLSQLGEFLSKFIPAHHFEQESSGSNSRRRIYSKENTFWGFFSQVLDADGGCKEVIRKFQAFSALKSSPLPSSSTSSYCQARKRLKQSELSAILSGTTDTLQKITDPNAFHGRRVVVVDGTGLSMPDTDENQRIWPQQKTQKAGCGFPQASLCACFCLHTGGLLSYELGNKKSHELPMLRKQMDTFKQGDIFLGDKGFCSYFDVSNFKDNGVDSVITLARRVPVSASESVKPLGENDLLIQWKRPVRHKNSSYTQEDWNTLPETLLLRQIKVEINNPGFRSETLYIITTLLDELDYPAADIADLYFKRWNVELFFRDIKTTMGMDILRCKTPDMVEKEITMHLIAYNCIRSLMAEVSEKEKLDIGRLSFKGSLQALRQWAPNFKHVEGLKLEFHRIGSLLYEAIADTIVPDRPGRSEPRAMKRRPKAFQLLNQPRHQMKVQKHRGKNYAKAA